MEMVKVRGADGSDRILALVRRDPDVVYVCPIGRFADVEAGDDDPVVGFPAADVSEVAEA